LPYFLFSLISVWAHLLVRAFSVSLSSFCFGSCSSCFHDVITCFTGLPFILLFKCHVRIRLLYLHKWQWFTEIMKINIIIDVIAWTVLSTISWQFTLYLISFCNLCFPRKFWNLQKWMNYILQFTWYLNVFYINRIIYVQIYWCFKKLAVIHLDTCTYKIVFVFSYSRSVFRWVKLAKFHQQEFYVKIMPDKIGALYFSFRTWNCLIETRLEPFLWAVLTRLLVKAQIFVWMVLIVMQQFDF